MRRGALKKQFYEELTDILDEQFPKGKCEERGPALVMFAKSFKMFDTLVKAFGGCDRCFGKGYGTKTEFASTGDGDFKPSKPTTWKLNSIVYCSCPRGRQLEELNRRVGKQIGV